MNNTTSRDRVRQKLRIGVDRSSRFALLERPWVLLALMAALCWTGTFLLLFLADLRAEFYPLAPQRIFFYVLMLTAGLLTFVPVQIRMRLPRLAFEGVTSTALLVYIIAFVPPPTGWLFALPDLPVYLLFITTLFWSASALVLPFSYALGQRMFKQRARQMDTRRARRQAYECGLLFALATTLAGLRVLTWVSFLLLALILMTVEILLLSRIEAGDT